MGAKELGQRRGGVTLNRIAIQPREGAMTEIQHRAKQIFEAEAAAIQAIRLNPAFDEAVRIIELVGGK